MAIILACIICIVVGYMVGRYFEPSKDVNIDKFKSYYNLLCKWLEMEENGKPADILIREQGYSKIAIYGMGNIGNRLVKVLQDTSIEVVCGIDSYSTNGDGLKVYNKHDELPDVDVIIVTVPFAYESIKSELEKKVEVPIVSFEHILFEV